MTHLHHPSDPAKENPMTTVQPATHQRRIAPISRAACALLAVASLTTIAGCGEFQHKEATAVTTPDGTSVNPVTPVADTVWAVALDRTPSGATALPQYLEWLGEVVLPDAAKAHAQVVVLALTDRAGAYTRLGSADFSNLGSDNENVTAPIVSERTQALIDQVAAKAPTVKITPTNPVASLSNAAKILASPEITTKRVVLLSDAVSTRPAECNLMELYAGAADPDPEAVAKACTATLPLDLTGTDVAIYGAATSDSVDIPDRVVTRTQEVIEAIVRQSGGRLTAFTPDPATGAR